MLSSVRRSFRDLRRTSSHDAQQQKSFVFYRYIVQLVLSVIEAQRSDVCDIDNLHLDLTRVFNAC